MAYRAHLGAILGEMQKVSHGDGALATTRVSGSWPFGDLHAEGHHTIFDYQSVWGFSSRHDVGSFSGTGTYVNTGGAIQITTGASSGGFARIETAEVGRYAPGRGAEFGLGIRFPVARPTGGIIKAGLGDTRNGFFYQWDDNGDGAPALVLRRDGTDISSVGFGDWNLSNPSYFNPASQGVIIGGQFVWYGYGKLCPIIWQAIETDKEMMTETKLHMFQVNTGTSLVDPNLPIFIEVSGAANTALELGGRRYDVLGQYFPDYRESGETKIASITAIASSWNPLVSTRLKANFPNANRETTVTAYIEGFDVFVNADAEIAIFENGVQSGSWGAATWTTSAEHATEFNITVASLNVASGQGILVGGPYLIKGGASQGNQPVNFSNVTESGISLPLVRGRTYTLAARATAVASLNAQAALRVQEEW